MKKISIFYFLFSIFFLHASFAQSVVFNRVYDYDTTYDFGRAVTKTLDNGYCIAAYVSNPIYGLYIVKTNETGDTQWTKIFDLTLCCIDQAKVILQLQDSSYVLCGRTEDTNNIKQDAFLMKLDKNGNSMWMKRYGGMENDYGEDVQQTADGGFIVAISSESFSANMDAYIVKTDSEGVIEWDTAYLTTENKYESIEKVVITPDSNYLIVGVGRDTGNIWLLKINSVGGILWEKAISFFNDPNFLGAAAQDIIIASDGGYVVPVIFSNTGGNNNGLLVKTDIAGNILWKQYYLASISESVTFQSVCEGMDSDYAVGGHGYTALTGGTHDGLILKADKDDGSLAWNRFFTSIYAGQGYVYDIQRTTDGGFIMCGDAFGAGVFKQDMWLVKTDPCGFTVGNSPQPIASFIVDSIINKTVYFQNTTVDGCTYKWNFGDGDSSFTFSPSHIYTDTGMKIITLYAYAGDAADTTSDTIWIYPTAINEFSISNFQFQIFPNPFSFSTTLSISSLPTPLPTGQAGNSQLLTFTLYDLLGRQVQQLPINTSPLTINREHLPDGLYFYQVTSDKKPVSRGKLLIQ